MVRPKVASQNFRPEGCWKVCKEGIAGRSHEEPEPLMAANRFQSLSNVIFLRPELNSRAEARVPHQSRSYRTVNRITQPDPDDLVYHNHVDGPLKEILCTTAMCIVVHVRMQ